jgi:hypothetical protein
MGLLKPVIDNNPEDGIFSLGGNSNLSTFYMENS